MRKNKTRKYRPVVKGKNIIHTGLLSILLAVISISCLYIWQRVTVVALAGRNKELKLEIKSKQEALKYLQIEVTKLASIERIEERGKQLGLIYPSLDQIKWLRESSDSVYLEKRYPPGSIWAKLTTLQKKLLSGEGAIAKEINHEP